MRNKFCLSLWLTKGGNLKEIRKESFKFHLETIKNLSKFALKYPFVRPIFWVSMAQNEGFEAKSVAYQKSIFSPYQ